MAVHIASPEVARRIRRLKAPADTVVSFADNLLIGPCAPEPARLAELRSEYWRGTPISPRNLGAMYSRLINSLASAEEIVIWSSGSLQHLALLWLICSIVGDRP